MTADDVIGKFLIAEKDVPVSFLPGGVPVGVVQNGLVVGPVYSWIQKNGKLYWMFDYTIPGQAPGSYYAEHRPEFWKLSTTGTAPGTINVTKPAVPTWAIWAGAAVLGIALLK